MIGRSPSAVTPLCLRLRQTLANSAALWNRSAGSFSSAVSTASSSAGEMVRRCGMSRRGCSVIIRATIACEVGPVNGGSPTSIS